MSSQNSLPLEIRRCLPSDQSSIWDLHVAALEAVGARAPEAAARFLDADLSKIDEVYLKSGGEFLVGVLRDQIVAMGALKRLGTSVAEITRMRVHPTYWRQGYGEATLHRLESAAKELSYSELWLDTLPIQTAAQTL
jgi:GNAT superfamily N-acetyltransferase